MKKLTFENETHWRTRDIQRIVRLAMVEGGVDLSERRIVHILHPKPPSKTKMKTKRKRRKSTGEVSNPSVVNIRFSSNALDPETLKVQGEEVQTEVTIFLPRQGAKRDHPVAMVALGANRAVAGVVDEDASLLPFSDVYFMANYLAYHFAYEALQSYEDEGGALALKSESLRDSYREISCPEWANASDLYIAKYKDPLKDATFLGFVKKKERAIKSEQTTIERLADEIASAQRKLKAAEKRKKAAEKSLKDAIARRK